MTASRVPLPTLDGPWGQVEHRFVRAGNLQVHVAQAGPPDAPPVVLLHGWPQHWWCWRHVVPLLADRYRLLLPDLRGHGWSDAPPSGYDKEQLATDLLALLDAVGLDQVALVGHDWGGWTGFLTSLRAPQRVRAFLALGIVHPWQDRSLRRAVNAWRLAYQVPLSAPVLSELVLRATPEVVERVIMAASVRREAFTPHDLRLFGAVLQEPARARATAQLYRTFLLRESRQVGSGRYADQRLTVPTRLLVGGGDTVAAGPFLDGWQQHADDMAVQVLPGVGHFVPEEAPQQVAEQATALFG